MKMVSQLTRQALSRHRLIAAGMAAAFPAPAPPLPRVSEETTGFQMLHPLYPSASSVRPMPDAAPSPPHAPSPPSPPRPHTVYQQLMTSHDRLTDRHLKRT